MQPTWLALDELPSIQLTSTVRPGLCQSLVSKHHFLGKLDQKYTNPTQVYDNRGHVYQTGPAYDLTFCEVRDHSVVVEWQKPVYTGSGPITGYHVEYAKKGSSDWTTANETAVNHLFYKVRASSV